MTLKNAVVLSGWRPVPWTETDATQTEPRVLMRNAEDTFSRFFWKITRENFVICVTGVTNNEAGIFLIYYQIRKLRMKAAHYLSLDVTSCIFQGPIFLPKLRRFLYVIHKNAAANINAHINEWRYGKQIHRIIL